MRPSIGYSTLSWITQDKMDERRKAAKNSSVEEDLPGAEPIDVFVSDIVEDLIEPLEEDKALEQPRVKIESSFVKKVNSDENNFENEKKDADKNVAPLTLKASGWEREEQ